MTVGNLELVTVLVFIMTGLVLFQLFSFVFALSQINRRLEQLGKTLQTFLQQGSAGLKAVQEVLSHLARIEALLSGAEARVSRLLKFASESVQKGDEAAGRTIEHLRNKVKEVNYRFDRGLSEVSLHAYRVHQAVLHPTRYLLARLEAAVSRLSRLFSRGGATPPLPYSAEEDIFI